MNCADDVEDAKNSSSEDEVEDKKPAGKNQHLNYDKVNGDSMAESPRAATGRTGGRASSAGVSSDEPLNQPSGRQNTPPETYNLPEDQEIVEVTEEEEE
jgi:hypothetical protein